MLDLAHQLVESMGGKLEFEIRKGYPTLYNDEALTARAKQNAINYLGVENVVDLSIWMAAEDYGGNERLKPGVLARSGVQRNV